MHLRGEKPRRFPLQEAAAAALRSVAGRGSRGLARRGARALSRTQGARPPQDVHVHRAPVPAAALPKQTRNRGLGTGGGTQPVLYCGSTRGALRGGPRSPASAHAHTAAGPRSASRLVHEAAPTGRSLLAQVAVAAASVQLDGAAVVLTVLALLLRGAHEAAQKVPWKQRRVRAAAREPMAAPPTTAAPRPPAPHGCLPEDRLGGRCSAWQQRRGLKCPSVGTGWGQGSATPRSLKRCQ